MSTVVQRNSDDLLNLHCDVAKQWQFTGDFQLIGLHQWLQWPFVSKLIFARHLYFMGDIYQTMAEISEKQAPFACVFNGCFTYRSVDLKNLCKGEQDQ